MGTGKRLQARGSFILALQDRSFVRFTAPGSWGEIVSRDGKKCLIRNEAGVGADEKAMELFI